MCQQFAGFGKNWHRGTCNRRQTRYELINPQVESFPKSGKTAGFRSYQGMLFEAEHSDSHRFVSPLRRVCPEDNPRQFAKSYGGRTTTSDRVKEFLLNGRHGIHVDAFQLLSGTSHKRQFSNL